MTNYELVCVLPGTLTEGEVTPILDKVKEVILTEGGESIETITQEKTKLNYPIKHIRYGYYETFTFEAEPEKIAAIQKKLGIMTELLRVLINKYSPEMRKRDIEVKAKIQTRRLANEASKAANVGKDEEAAEATKAAGAPVEDMKEQIQAVEKIKEEKIKTAKKVDLGDIDKKLDELLGGDLENV